MLFNGILILCIKNHLTRRMRMQFTTGEQTAVTVYLVSNDQSLDMLSEDVSSYVTSTLDFKGKSNEVFTNLGPNSENVVLVGLGDETTITKDSIVHAATTATKELNKVKVTEASFKVNSVGDLSETDVLKGMVEGALHADYTFDTYKSEKQTNSLKQVSLLTEVEDASELIEEVVTLLDGVNLTRDLVNTPANDLYPETLAQKVLDKFEGTDVDVQVFDKAQLEEMGADALLAVSHASVKEPRLIVLSYLPLGDSEPAVSLVGKGVTYDSGGYAIKTAKGMAGMKTDMAGAASMIGTMYALAKNKVQKNAVAVIAATENMIAGDAMKNGDIIGSLKGTTIEVLNTDAEGRLILADALYYAATKVNSSCIIDAATLTGAVIAALGKNITGTMTNDQALLDEFQAVSKSTGEDMWQLPIHDDFKQQTKGKISDLVNIAVNSSGAGTMFAAAFLEHFVEETPWIHLDIAGTSSSAKGNKYLPDGASGIPVKTLYEFVKAK